MARSSDDSHFPSSMNLQDLLDMSSAVPEECATSLPTAHAQGKIAAVVEGTADQPFQKRINYDDNIATKITSIYESQEFADVTFLVGEEKSKLNAHKLILALSSSVFTAMFYGDLSPPPSANWKGPIQVEVPDCTARAFQAMLHYMYKGSQPSLTVDDALSLLYAARKYAVRGLEDMCCILLSSSITADNVFDILYAATFYNLPALDHECWQFIEENAVQVLSSHLDYLTHETVHQMLNNDKLNANEAELFRVLVKWAELECKKHELPQTPENLRHFLADELKLLRFPTMTGQEFAEVVVPTKILTLEQVAKVFTVINTSAECKSKDDNGHCSTEFCDRKRIPAPKSKGEKGSRPNTPRPPVFTFIADQQIRNNAQGSAGRYNSASTVDVDGTTDGNNTNRNNGPQEGNPRNRQRQTRRSRRRGNNNPSVTSHH